MEDRSISLTILDAKYNRNVSIEQAKKYLYAKIDGLCDDEYNTFSKIIDDMYNELQPVNPQSDEIADGDRAISLNAVLDTLEMLYLRCKIDDLTYQRLKELPSVTPSEEEKTIKYMKGYNAGFCHAQAIFQKERPKGHWISHYDKDAKEGWYECDRCHTERAFNTDFCPDCGAKMVEPQESEG